MYVCPTPKKGHVPNNSVPHLKRVPAPQGILFLCWTCNGFGAARLVSYPATSIPFYDKIPVLCGFYGYF